MRILGVIPARGGSTRIPRKNLQSVGGMSLVERALYCARDTTLLRGLVVSTDDDEIASVVRKVVPSWRLGLIQRKCGPDGPMVDVLRDALEQVGGVWDAVCTIQPTSPLRTSEDIDECVRLWERTRAEQDYAWSNPDFEPGLWGGCVVSLNEDTGKRNGAVYVSAVEAIHDGEVFTGESRWDREYLMPASRSLDINTPADLEEARRLLGP